MATFRARLFGLEEPCAGRVIGGSISIEANFRLRLIADISVTWGLIEALRLRWGEVEKLVAVLLWGLTSVGYWAIVLLGAGLAGGVGAIVGISVALALWLTATTFLTDWLGLTRVWPHYR